MRRTSIIRIVVVLAALALLVPSVLGSEQNRPATDRAPISQVPADPADALDTTAKPSLPERASPGKLSFTDLSVAAGLSHSDVRAIAQDQQGFMWFGTWLGGLNRYDGYTFKVYKHDDQDERSLAADSYLGALCGSSRRFVGRDTAKASTDTIGTRILLFTIAIEPMM